MTTNKKPSLDRLITITFVLFLAVVCGGTVLADSIHQESSTSPSRVTDGPQSSAF